MPQTTIKARLWPKTHSHTQSHTAHNETISHTLRAELVSFQYHGRIYDLHQCVPTLVTRLSLAVGHPVSFIVYMPHVVWVERAGTSENNTQRMDGWNTVVANRTHSRYMRNIRTLTRNAAFRIYIGTRACDRTKNTTKSLLLFWLANRWILE